MWKTFKLDWFMVWLTFPTEHLNNLFEIKELKRQTRQVLFLNWLTFLKLTVWPQRCDTRTQEETVDMQLWYYICINKYMCLCTVNALSLFESTLQKGVKARRSLPLLCPFFRKDVPKTFSSQSWPIVTSQRAEIQKGCYILLKGRFNRISVFPGGC